MNRDLAAQIREGVVLKVVEHICTLHLEEIVKRVNFDELAKDLIKAIDFRKLASEVAAKVTHQVFTDKCQTIIASLDMKAIANMTAAYTGRLVADTLTVLPKSQNG